MNQPFPRLASVAASPGSALPRPADQVVPARSFEQATPELVQEPSDARSDLLRIGSGLGFAALYGLALGARSGGTSLLRHAWASSAGLLAVGALGLPALFVLLALVDAPVSPGRMFAAGARALHRAGFVLAGLAPSTALLAVTIESPAAAAFVAQAGLLLAGGIGLYQLASAVRRLLLGAPLALRLKGNALLFAFCVFALFLAARVWDALPILQGAR